MRHLFPSRRTAALTLTAGCLLSLLFSACTPSDRFSAGRPISREELDSIAESIRDAEYHWDPDADYPAGTVFWGSRGTGYHTNPHCRHLANATEVFHGTQEEATAAGKTKDCSSCLQTETESETETD